MSKKILIIDDKEVLFATSTICQFEDWITMTAMDVESGIKKYKDKKPDIILIDYNLPLINGIEGVKMFRKIDKDIPIIALAAEECQNIADGFVEAGASDFAIKPLKTPDIVSRIKIHLKMVKIIKGSSQDLDDYAKNISPQTLERIEKYMNKEDKYYTINNISDATGLAYQTIHRYLQYMEYKNIIELSYRYGKIGRPQKRYRAVK